MLARYYVLEAREFQKNIYFCFIDYVKAFNCVAHKKLWKNYPRDGNTRPPYLPPEKPYAGQEAIVRGSYGATDWFQIGKGECKGHILSPCLFNLYAEYIMRNARLDEAQAGVKIAGRNINNLRYADDTTLKAESEEKLKNLLMKMKEESETKIMASSPITSWQTDGKTMETMRDFMFLGSKSNTDGDCSHEVKCLLLGRNGMTHLESILKSRDFANKGPSTKAMIFPVVTYGCESWTVKKAEH